MLTPIDVFRDSTVPLDKIFEKNKELVQKGRNLKNLSDKVIDAIPEEHLPEVLLDYFKAVTDMEIAAGTVAYMAGFQEGAQFMYDIVSPKKQTKKDGY